jgi:hypothetical protein
LSFSNGRRNHRTATRNYFRIKIILNGQKIGHSG